MMAMLIGERANLPTWRPRHWPAVSSDHYWLLMVRLGAFADARSRRKLLTIGVDVTACDSANLLPPDPQGIPWDAAKAREVAAAWLLKLAGRDSVYLVGVRVSTAFGLKGPMRRLYGRMTELTDRVSVIVLPHPSGLNHFWNDI